MNKRKTTSSPLVYSTDPLFMPGEFKKDITTPDAGDQKLKVYLDKKHRAGKVVTLITGFSGREEDLEQLGKELKSFCGTGGSVKDGIIIIQGDNREKVFQKLSKNGYGQVIKM